MKYILLHGIGQTKESWQEVKLYLEKNKINTLCPDLLQWMRQANYQNLFNEFAKYCNHQKEKLNLCGLSLGGLLALDYAKKYPEKVNSLILIGIPHKIPKLLFRFQNIIFRITPKKIFDRMGIKKQEFCNLLKSMTDLKIASNIEKISCPCLILYGESDYINKISKTYLNQNIQNSMVKIIPKSSHEVNVDNPIELSEVINHFWKNME